MEAEAASEEALDTLWRARGLRVADLSIETDGTIASARRAPSSRARTRSAPPRPSGPVPDATEITLGDELGRGGMGVVSLAGQRSLRREVAVKRAIDAESDGADLVEEAWVLAHLAHPSVVPVHALAVLEGAPAVVMKRIAGTPWSDVLHAEGHALTTGDRLGWHLRILVEVARAIEHAHAHGVLHLDLKAQNVMIGAFGEVYVLDWGLAARVGDAPAWLAPASKIDSVAGTPELMAPEIAMGEGAHIEQRTDVFLLGAILHEVVTGRPRHDGKNPVHRLFLALTCQPPTFEADVPAELAAIVTKATAKELDARFDDVRSFREAIEACLRNREADLLFVRAQREAALLDAALAEPVVERSRVHAHFGGARFASREARAMRPSLDEGRALEARVFRSMVRFALRSGEIALAESYLSEVPGGDAPLRAEIEAVRASADARAAHVRRLEKMASEEDLSEGRTMRSHVAFALAIAFLAANLGMSAIERSGLHHFGYLDVVVAVLGLSVAIPWVWARRRQLLPNRAGAGIWATILCALVVVQCHWALSAALGLEFATSLAFTPIYYMLCYGALATLLDPRLWPAVVVQVPTALLAAAFPAWIYEIIGVGAAISVIYLAVVWAERARRTRRPQGATP